MPTSSTARAGAPIAVADPAAPVVVPAASSRPTVAAVVPWAALALLTVAVVVGMLVFPTQPSYDSQWSLIWGHDILQGRLPSFDAYRAPSEHPLLLVLCIPLAALGDAGGRLLVGVAMVSMLLVLVGVYRLGRLAAGVFCGLVTAALVGTRLDFWLVASIGYLDIPYCALVCWALVLELERPRRGRDVWVLLTLAGLLRPEAWLLAFAYAPWMALGVLPAATRRTAWRGMAGARALLVPAGLALLAPVVWCVVDLIVTGDPLFTFHHTDELAVELARGRPLHTLPRQMIVLIDEIIKWPVLVLACIGIVFAARRRVRWFAPLAVLTVITCLTYLLIASGGLATVYRYLLTAALALMLFAAYAMTGWTTLAKGDRWRTPWIAGALVLMLVGTAYTLTHSHPVTATKRVRQRVQIRTDLLEVLNMPAALKARRCGPISVPNHKLVPDILFALDLPRSAVVSRSRYVPKTGLALIIDRRWERLPQLNVYEVASDDGFHLQDPPPGFTLVGGNRRFAIYSSCP
jgi:hypothetical protein